MPWSLNDTDRALLWRPPATVSQETFISHGVRTLALLSLALIAALTIVACGGDSGGDEDPRTVLDATLDSDPISSGVVDLSLSFESEGGDNPGSVEATVDGPFQSSENGIPPAFDLSLEAQLDTSDQDFSGDAGVISTGEEAFVSFQDTDYELPANTVRQLADPLSRGRGFFSLLASNSADWLTDLSNEGTEDVEGTETIHISGQADVPKLVVLLKQIVDGLPQLADQFTPQQLRALDQLTSLIRSADFDIYTGADDDILRRIDASLEIEPPAGAASSSVSLDLSASFQDVNEPQTITAPADAQSLSTLLEQLELLGVDPGQLGSIGSATGGGSGGGGSAGGSSTGSASPATQAFLECLEQAVGQDAVDQCTAQLGE